MESCFLGFTSFGDTNTHTAILQAAEPPLPAATPSVLRLQPPLSTLHGQPGQGRQLLLNILHIKNSVKPGALEGQGLCSEANWCTESG